VVDEVGVEDLGEGGDIATRDDLCQGPAGGGLDVPVDELRHERLLGVVGGGRLQEWRLRLLAWSDGVQSYPSRESTP
jgi:hypothetical protein